MKLERINIFAHDYKTKLEAKKYSEAVVNK